MRESMNKMDSGSGLCSTLSGIRYDMVAMFSCRSNKCVLFISVNGTENKEERWNL
jgi:hypothetical protein